MAKDGVTLARAYVEIIPTVRGIQGGIGEEIFGPLKDQAGKAGDESGKRTRSRFMDTLKRGLSRAVIGVGVGVGGVFATSIAKGFGRLSAIEEAESKLLGIGNTSEEVSIIMDNALASVKGTAFGLGEAATTSAAAVAAGLKPGQELEGYLRAVADAATIAGTDLESMGSIFGKVATSGKVQGDVLNQLSDRGIPIVTMLAEQLGVTSEEVYKLGSAGKIGLDDFLGAMSSIEGAALEAGSTTQGAIANVGAAMGRFGANILTGIYPLIGPLARAVTDVFDALADLVGPVMEEMAARFTPGLTSAIESVFGGIVAGIESINPQALVDGLGTVVDWLSGGWLDSLQSVVGGIIDSFKGFGDGAVVGGIVALGGVGAGLASRFGLVGKATGALAKRFGFLGPILAKLSPIGGALLAAFRPLTGLFSTIGGVIGRLLAPLGKVMGVIGGALGRLTPLLSRFTGFLGPLAPVLGKVGGLLGRFSPLLRLVGGPLGLVVTLLATAYATSEDFREAVHGVIGILGGLVAELGKALLPLLVTLGESLGVLAGAVALVLGDVMAALVPAISGILTALLPALGTLAEVIGTVVGVLVDLLVPIIEAVVPVVAILAVAVGKILAGALAVLTPVLTWIAGFIGDVLIVALDLLGKAFEWIGENVVPVVQEAVAWFVAWLQDTAVPWLTEAWEKVSEGAGELIPKLQAVWDSIMDAIGVAIDWITGTFWPAMQSVWDGVMGVIGAVYDWITGTLVPGLQTAWDGIASAVTWLYESIIMPIWNAIGTVIDVVVIAIKLYIGALVLYFRHVVAPVFTWLYESIVKPVWEAIRAAIDAVVTWFRDTAWPAIKAVIDFLVAAFEFYRDALQAVWAFVKDRVIAPVIAWFRDTAWPAIKSVIDFIVAAFEFYRDAVQRVWRFVKDQVIQPVIAWFRDTAWPFIRNTLHNIRDGFFTMRDNIRDAWNAVKDSISRIWNENIKPIFDTVMDVVKNDVVGAFETAKSGIETAWNKIKDIAKKPVEFVVNTVIWNLADAFDSIAGTFGVKKLNFQKVSFASGGIMPGYTPGRDVHRFYSPTGGLLDLSGGEAIMRPEFTRAIGGESGVHRLNALARAGRLGDAFGGHQAFAGGGVFKRLRNLSGDALDWLKDKASLVSEALSDPGATMKRIVDGLMGSFPAMTGAFGDMVKGIPGRIAKAAGDFLLNALGSVGMTEGSVPQVGAQGTGWARASNAARALGLRFTSGYRPGSRTARTGSVSLHALGRARDYAGSASAMRAFFNIMDQPPYPTELLYTPMYGRNIHRGGRRYANSGATARMHWDHVHVGFKGGGVWPGVESFLHDKGGWHPPNTWSLNQLREPEAVLTAAQWETMEAIAESASKGSRGDVIVQVEHRDGEDPSTFGRRVGEALDLQLLSIEGV